MFYLGDIDTSRTTIYTPSLGEDEGDGQGGCQGRRHEGEYRYTAWQNVPKNSVLLHHVVIVKRPAPFPIVQPSRPRKKGRSHNTMHKEVAQWEGIAFGVGEGEGGRKEPGGMHKENRG